MENIGKKVYVQNSGEHFGYVLNVVISQEDFKKIGYIVVEEKTESEFLLNKNDIAFCGDAIFVTDNQSFQFVSNASNCLIGKDVFDEKGKYYGFVCDIQFVKGKLIKLTTELCDIPTKFLKKIDGDFIFVCFSRKCERKKKQIKKLISDEKILKIEKIAKSSSTPQKVNLVANYYIGKTAKCDIFGYNNERILQKNVKITKSIFENVKKHNKLNELFFLLNN